MLKRSLLFGIGMAACVVPCWPDTALADNCHGILDQQIIPPKSDDLLSLVKALVQFAKAGYDFSKDPKKVGDFLGAAANIVSTIQTPAQPNIDGQFQELQNELLQIYADINLQISETKNLFIADKVSEWNEAITSALLAVADARDDISKNKTTPQEIGRLAIADSETVKAVVGGFGDFYWSRLSNACSYTTDSRWMQILSLPKATKQFNVDSVFEWRYMVPYILYAIPSRIHVMTGVHPNWGVDGYFDTDLDLFASDLSKKLGTMTDGVQCATRERLDSHLGVNNSLTTKAACAEIYTGLSQYQEYQGSLPPNSDPSFPKKLAALRRDHAGQAQRFFQVAKSWVIERIQLFEMKSMVDALHYFRSHAPDLTEARHRIPLAGAPNLCLQDGGDSNPVVMASCSGINNTQKWQYDRATGLIFNKLGPLTNNHGRCLTIPNKVQPIPDTRVVSKKCEDDGNKYQKWTYDPTTQRLSNAFGTVLATGGGDYVYLDYFYDSQAHSWSQSWLADVPLQRVICGRFDLDCGN